jgi:hypothetical protein
MLDFDRRDKRVSVEAIARMVGSSKPTLYRDPQFQAARKALKLKRRQANLPKGYKTAEGNVEAYDDNEPEE